MLKYLIAVPCMDMMHTVFVASLMYMRRVGASRVTFLSNSLVYDARDKLAREAIETGADRVLWLDSDMQFGNDLMERLAEDMDEGRDFVCGLYFRRRIPTVPILAKEHERDGLKCLDTYVDYPRDQIFEVDAAGFGAVMCSTKMLQDAYDHFGNPFYPVAGHGEDYALCTRVRELGYKLYCDSRIKVGHIGQIAYGEELYKQ